MSKRLLSFLFFSLALISCSEEEPTSPDQMIEIPNATLSDIQTKVFTPGCTASGCHGNSNPQRNLRLTDGNSFSNLVNVQSVLFTSLKRVEPGSSANSVLIKMLKGELLPRMPQSRTPLPIEAIDSIAAWIDGGAPNN
jgi:hypothetical protein